MLDFWSGYKTNIVAALTVIYGTTGYLTGHVDLNDMAQLVSVGAGLATLRQAIKSV